MTIEGLARQEKIVVHYRDGRILKGHTRDFFPATKDIFHLSLVGSSEKPIEINLNELKAVFFVKDFIGRKVHERKKEFVETVGAYGRKIIVTFYDGETMYGYTQGYSSGRKGFFLFPVDPEDNNTKVYVVSSAVRETKLL